MEKGVIVNIQVKVLVDKIPDCEKAITEACRIFAQDAECVCSVELVRSCSFADVCVRCADWKELGKAAEYYLGRVTDEDA